MENNVMTPTQPATLAIRWSTIAAAAVGVCVGMVIGAVGVQEAINGVLQGSCRVTRNHN